MKTCACRASKACAGKLVADVVDVGAVMLVDELHRL